LLPAASLTSPRLLLRFIEDEPLACRYVKTVQFLVESRTLPWTQCLWKLTYSCLLGNNAICGQL
jgi:hypothetical protein